MDKNLQGNSSYSDLFEDFFRSDAGVVPPSESSNDQDIFNELLGITEDKRIQNQYLTMQSNDPAVEFYLQQQQQQQQQQIQQQQAQFQPQPFYYQYPSMVPAATTVTKPGFIRNRARKNMRQKSVASVIKASHLMSSAANPCMINNGNTFIQSFQQPLLQQQQQQQQQQAIQQMQMQTQIPYYQAAAQISSYQSQHPVQLAAKSPAPQMTFMRSSHPPSPSSARSPNNNSSDYVKMRLQQKIRSRMVSKGQIPPNPTEEELRMCGVQVPLSPLSHHNQPYHNKPQPQMVTVSQLPTPKQSPQQIPRAFNNNAAAYISAPSVISNQMQIPMQEYIDINGYSQKDPLSMDTSINIIKQQQLLLQHQASTDLYPPSQQQQSQQEMLPTVNYDQFFSDFILY